MKTSKPAITEEERELFRSSLKDTRPLSSDKVPLLKPKPKAKLFQKSPTPPPELQRSEAEPETETLLTEDSLFFARSGLQTRVIRKLQRGGFPREAELDLHGLSVDQAQSALERFIAESIHRSYRCVIVIHGKGSSTKAPILKNKVNYWLRQYRDVLAFCSARPSEGGKGAIYVLLKNPLSRSEARGEGRGEGF